MPHHTQKLPADTPLVIGSTHAGETLHTFPCKQCGASLAFSPGVTALECPYCGYREDIPVTPEEIREHDLLSALRTLPRTPGWGMTRRALHCETCGATTTFGEGQVAGNCAFCGSARVVEHTAANIIRPESLIPFAIRREEAAALFRQWIARLWFRPNDLKQISQLGQINGVYLPFWTFDSFTSAYWTADAGYHYWETETYWERDANGNQVLRTRQVQKTRWVPASGSRQDFFDDELICASKGLPPDVLRGISPFDLTQLKPYDPAFLAGFSAEEYQVSLDEGWQAASRQIEQKVRRLCSQDVPGDTQRNLRVNCAFSQMTYKHLLLPVWVAAYRYRDQSYRFLVNGLTGKAFGEAPYSFWKLAGLFLLLTLVILAAVLLMKAFQGT